MQKLTQLEPNRFTVKIVDTGADGQVSFEVTTEPYHPGVQSEVESMLPGIIGGKGKARSVVVFAEPGMIPGRAKVSHNFSEGTEIVGNALDRLYAVARRGLKEWRKAVEAANTAIGLVTEEEATRVANFVVMDPSLLGNLSINLLPLQKCSGCGRYHPTSGVQFDGRGGLAMFASLLIGGRQRDEMYDGRFAEVEQQMQALTEPGFVVFDPDGKIGNSPFRDAVTQHLLAQVTPLVKGAVPRVVAVQEAEFERAMAAVREAAVRQDEKRRALAAAGIVLPVVNTAVAGLLAQSVTPADGGNGQDGGHAAEGEDAALESGTERAVPAAPSGA